MVAELGSSTTPPGMPGTQPGQGNPTIATGNPTTAQTQIPVFQGIPTSSEDQLAFAVSHAAAMQSFLGIGWQAHIVNLQVSVESRIAAIENKLKDIKEHTGSGIHREILEYKSIQNIEKIEGSRGYRTWNEKFKNAMSQVRGYGRKGIEYIETLTMKEIDDEWDLDLSVP